MLFEKCSFLAAIVCKKVLKCIAYAYCCLCLNSYKAFEILFLIKSHAGKCAGGLKG